MDKELLDRLEIIEKKISYDKKDFWEKLKILTPILIPIAIAFVGWYYTNEHNNNQLDLQKENNENQRQIALINSTVGQSNLIEDFIPHLTSKDTVEQNIALIAILYAAPAPGKEIVGKIANSNNKNTSEVAQDALATKRKDLVNSLFSLIKHDRLIAANEIVSNWNTDGLIVRQMIQMSKSCLKSPNEYFDCSNGVFNVIVVLQNFPEELLLKNKNEIKSLADLIPIESENTKNEWNKLLKKIE